MRVGLGLDTTDMPDFVDPNGRPYPLCGVDGGGVG